MIAEKQEERSYRTYRTSEIEQELFSKLARARHSSIAAILVNRAQREIEKINRRAQEAAQEAIQVDGSSLKPTTNFSLRISDEMDQKIATLAESRGVSKTELIHKWLWQELEEDGIAVLTKPIERRIPPGSKVVTPATRKPGRPRKVESDQGPELPKAHAPLIARKNAVKHRSAKI